jgi:hypothetical protein
LISALNSPTNEQTNISNYCTQGELKLVETGRVTVLTGGWFYFSLTRTRGQLDCISADFVDLGWVLEFLIFISALKKNLF